MTDRANIKAVRKVLESATLFSEIFGILPKGDEKTKNAYLRKQFALLVRSIHPDHVTDSAKTEATNVFRMVNEAYNDAKSAITNGVYDVVFAFGTYASETVSDSGVILQSTGTTYTLDSNPFKDGDLSTLYKARAVGIISGVVLLKIASEPVLNPLLEHEVEILNKFYSASANPVLVGLQKTLPQILDTFMVIEENNIRYRVNVIPFSIGMISVSDIVKKFDGKMDPRDAVWICRRVIAHAITANMVGVVHSAIVPDHILVHPVRHEPLYLGWAHSLGGKSGRRMTQIMDRWKDWYPPEVFEKKSVDHRTDIYMAGKTMTYLLGGDVKRNILPSTVPSDIRSIVLTCTEASPNNRPNDALQILNDFSKAVWKNWEKKYRRLEMPIS